MPSGKCRVHEIEWEDWRRRDWPRPRSITKTSGRQGIARQREIDASIAAKADYEYLYDKPYE